jgi:hypothetical protein
MNNRNIAIFGNGMSGLLAQQLDSARATRDLGFEQGVKAERERLAGLIEAAKGLRDCEARDSMSDYMQQFDSGIVNSIHELIEALGEYEESINE